MKDKVMRSISLFTLSAASLLALSGCDLLSNTEEAQEAVLGEDGALAAAEAMLGGEGEDAEEGEDDAGSSEDGEENGDQNEDGNDDEGEDED